MRDRAADVARDGADAAIPAGGPPTPTVSRVCCSWRDRVLDRSRRLVISGRGLAIHPKQTRLDM
jgi:hypothetical protein